MKKTIHVLALLNLSVFLKSHIFLFPVLYLFYSANGITLADFFVLQGINSLTCLLLDVPMGYIADRFSKKNILIFSGFIQILRFVLLYCYPTKVVIFLGELLYAFVIVSFVGTGDSYIYELLKTENKTIKMLKRYGRLYFWISLGSSISSLIGAYFYEILGANEVILLTIVFSAISTLILFFIPDIQTLKNKDETLAKKYVSLFKSVKRSFQEKEFINLVGYSAFLTLAYQIFMWSMQPVMKASMVPISFFGVIFFFNHISRACGSYFAHQILKKVSLKSLGWIVYWGFIFCFFAMILASLSTNYIVTIVILISVCAMIAIQVTWLVSAIARIHDISESNNRALSASVNSMAGRLMTALCLIMSKFVLDDNPIQVNLLLFLVLFISSIFILKRFSVSEEKL